VDRLPPRRPVRPCRRPSHRLDAASPSLPAADTRPLRRSKRASVSPCTTIENTTAKW
jgi:hypothetical protein